MKRMSDVFKLPVSVSLMGDKHAGEITKGDHPHYCLEDNNYWMLSDIEQTQHAAHAINHVDALADALGDIVFDYFATINLSNVDMATLNPELHKKITVATDALAAYRGDK